MVRISSFSSIGWIFSRGQTPYRFQSRNHGLCAYITSCLRFAAERSLNWVRFRLLKKCCARPEDVAAGRFRPPASLGPRIGGRLDQESLHFVHFWNVELRHGADLLEHLPH